MGLMFKSATESIQSQLDNPKINTIKLHGTITDALVVRRSVTFTGKVSLQAPILLESGLQVTFVNLDVLISGWNGQIGATESYSGNISLDNVVIRYSKSIANNYIQHADTGQDIVNVFVANGQDSSIDIKNSKLANASLDGNLLSVSNSTIGKIFGPVSGYYGRQIAVDHSELSNFDLTGVVQLSDVSTTGNLHFYNLSNPAQINGLTINGPHVSEKTGEMLPIQQQMMRVYKVVNRINDNDAALVTAMIISGDADITDIKVTDLASNLIDKYGYGLALIEVTEGIHVTIKDSAKQPVLEYVSISEGDIIISGEFNEDIETQNNGRISVIADESNQDEHGDVAEPKGALVQLNALIGLQPVKSQIKKIIASVTMRKRRHQKMPSLHMIFSGNAGTGKTTVAGLVAEALFENGVIESSKVVVATKKDLVAGYVGQTAEKTKQIIESAYGGVLFIDEAYTLTSDSSSNGFEAEAIAELIAQMENHRDNLIVIMAGYTNEMKRFIDSNQGLNSRFKTWIEFPDYDAKELTRITLLQLRSQDVPLHKQDGANILKMMNYFVAHHMNDGNGRFARNFSDAIIENRDVRLFEGSTNENITKDDYIKSFNGIKSRSNIVTGS